MPRNVLLFLIVTLLVLVMGASVLLLSATGGGLRLNLGSEGSGDMLLPAVFGEATPAADPSAYPGQNEGTGAPQPSAESAVPQTRHQVQPGDTLLSIARQYEIEMGAIVAANVLPNPDALTVGQELVIPQMGDGISAEVAAASADQPVDVTVNGLTVDQIVIMPPNVVENARAIYQRGQALGRNAQAYSKVGDSTIANPHFMARFDSTPYNLADYAYLQPTIDYFAGSHGRDSAAQRIGLHAWTVLDPTWADNTICQPNETPLACEIRIHNPAVVIVRLGSNDAGAPELFGDSLRQIVQQLIEAGVVPVLGTKADRHEGSNQNNDIIRQISAEFEVPLWEFDVVAGTMPGRGLDVDNVHMLSFYAHDYSQPEAFTRGHGMHNLTALMVLDALRTQVMGNG